MKCLLGRFEGLSGEVLWKRLGAVKISSYGGRGHKTFSFWRCGIEFVESLNPQKVPVKVVCQ